MSRTIVGAAGVSLWVSLCPFASAAVLAVPSQYRSIQAAINASVAGDTIEVGPGIYSESLNFGGRAITVRSTAGASTTIVDPVNGRCFTANGFETAAARLEGFTLRGGGADNGGGVYVESSSPTIVNCVITGNASTGYSGGGVYVASGSSRFVGCTVSLNTCSLYGGGIHVAGGAPVFENCNVFGNTVTGNGFSAGYGGGLYMANGASVTLLGGSMSGNTANGGGGGVLMGSSGTLTASGWQVTGNSSTGQGSQGGGIYAGSGTVQLTGCTVASNTAVGSGGGISSNSAVSLSDCTVDFNSSSEGVGAWLKSGPTCWVQGTRIRNNSGASVGGIMNNSGNLSVSTSQFCGNATNLSGPWTNGGGNQFSDQCAPYCPGDADGDSQVNAEDITRILSDWGICGSSCGSDFNTDGIVNGADLTYVLSQWGPCPGW